MWLWLRCPQGYQEFFQGSYDANLPKKTNCRDCGGDKGQPPCCNRIAFMSCVDGNSQDAAPATSSCRHTERPCDHSCSGQCHDTSPPHAHNADSVKTAPLNGMIAPCIILPLDHKQQRILTPCTNMPNPLNHMTVNCPHAAPIQPHNVNATLTSLTTPMTTNVLVNAAALAVACTAVHAAVIVMMMIASTSVPLVNAVVLHLLGIMTFSLQASPTRWTQLLLTNNIIITLVTILPILKPHNNLICQIIPGLFVQGTCQSTKMIFWHLLSFWRSCLHCLACWPQDKPKPPCSFWWLWKVGRPYNSNIYRNLPRLWWWCRW